jgi:hypothetical protein
MAAIALGLFLDLRVLSHMRDGGQLQLPASLDVRGRRRVGRVDRDLIHFADSALEAGAADEEQPLAFLNSRGEPPSVDWRCLAANTGP